MKELNFFDKIGLIISHPHKFFEEIKEEKNIWKVFEFYFALVLISAVINSIFIMPELVKNKMFLGPVYFTLIIIIFIIAILLAVSLISCLSFGIFWLNHIIIKIFNGKKRFKETYQTLYASTPLLLACLIPYYGFFKILFYPVLAIALVDSVYIEYIALQKLQKLSKENAIAVIIIGLLFFFIIFKIFMKTKIL
jgi:hypothetical protein